ncbi:MAG TPA: histidine kinase [Chloroflexota bacterium]|nr:histidine kinase [Chloroflexota bacterium]
MAGENARLRARLDAARQGLARQQRELDALAAQTRMQLGRERERFAQVREKLDTLDRTLERYSREELRQLFQAAKEREVYLATLRAELEGLEFKRAALAEEGRTLEQLVALLGGEAEPGGDEALPAGVAARDAGGDPAPVSDFGALLLAQEADRSRLALMLHDRVAQPLHNLVLQTEVLLRAFKADPAAAHVELEGLRETATRVLQDARRVIFALRPMSLDDLGLLPTLDRYAQVCAEQDQLATRIRKEGRPRPLPPIVETAVYRIVEAALTNVRDHAGVKEAEVLVTFTDSELLVTVVDGGRGCNLRLAEAAPGGSGMLGMRERARQVGGTIVFDSAPGQGMTVRLTVPLAAAGGGRRAAVDAAPRAR